MVYFPIHQHIIEKNAPALEADLSCPNANIWCAERSNGDLPLAMAIKRRMKEKLVLKILKLFPKAASLTDKSGDLPLHNCCKYGTTTTILEALLLEFPYALEAKSINSNGMSLTARELALCNSSRLKPTEAIVMRQSTSHWIDLKEYMYEKGIDESKMGRLEKTLSKVTDDLLVARTSEQILQDKLAMLEIKFAAFELRAKCTIDEMEGRLDAKIQEQDSYIIGIRNDVTTVAAREDASCHTNKQLSNRLKSVEKSVIKARRGSMGSRGSVGGTERRNSMGRRYSGRGGMGEMRGNGLSVAAYQVGVAVRTNEKVKETLKAGAGAAFGLVMEQILPM